METPRVRSGSLVALRLHDVSYSIDLALAEALWNDRPGGSASRPRLTGQPARALSFEIPPVLLNLDPGSVTLSGNETRYYLSAKLYDFGVLALRMSIPVRDLAWGDLVSLVDRVEETLGVDSGNALWENALSGIRGVILPAMNRPSVSGIEEEYLGIVVREWDRPVKGSELPSLVDLPRVLSGETIPLSPGARRDLVRKRFSYHEDDLVVVAWNRAFISDPRCDSDTLDILEAANAQLLELRYYDRLLDNELPRMYALVEKARKGLALLTARRYANLARRLHTLVAEVTELTERAENTLRVTEDVHLARIYTAALEIFRVPVVGAAVDRKLSIIRDTYSALFQEASGKRGEILEIAVVLLIVAEIVITLLRHGA